MGGGDRGRTAESRVMEVQMESNVVTFEVVSGIPPVPWWEQYKAEIFLGSMALIAAVGLYFFTRPVE